MIKIVCKHFTETQSPNKETGKRPVNRKKPGAYMLLLHILYVLVLKHKPANQPMLYDWLYAVISQS